MLAAVAAIGLAACTSQPPREPPPEVAPQPPDITAGEAIAEGREAEQQQEAVKARVQRQRQRPTSRSIAEIRSQNAAAPVPLDFRQRLDGAHDRIYTWGQSAVQATDHYFADKDKPLQAVPAAPFRVGTSLLAIDRADGVELDADATFDISLQLPNVEERLGIFITSDEIDGGTRGAGEDSQLRAGLRYRLLRHLDFDLGARLDIPPVAFASVKWTHEYRLGRWDFYPLAKLFAESHDGVGVAAGATFDRWSGRTLLRSSSHARWRPDNDRTEWSQTLIYARAGELIVPDRYGSYPRADDIGRGWGLRLLASGEDTHGASRYEAGIFYRRRTRARWLYWHAEPLVRWDKAYGWNADPGLRVGLDLLFWDLARRNP